MRVAVIADIHGNLEAFKEVLADITQERVDEVVCLGDNIGYGPDPEEVVRLLRRLEIPSVMGNHELGLVNKAYLTWFNPSALESLLLTQRLLSPETFFYMRLLPPNLVMSGCLFVHGCPPDSITTYLYSASDAYLRALFGAMEEKLCFVGHTHDLALVCSDGVQILRLPLPAGHTLLDEGCKYIVNVGSVGQPRDGNNNAKYVIWDSAMKRLEVRFVPYDMAPTAEKILALGFPEFNARRLW